MADGSSARVWATRNLGFLTDDEQARVEASHVAIAGVGGDGGLVAELLVRLGVGALTIADPEVFEIENLNRQAFSTTASLGRRKVDVVADGLRAIRTTARVECFPEGITAANVDRFVAGADLVIDETEYTLHHLAVMLGRAARARGLTVITGFNIAFGAATTAFVPDGTTVEEFLGCDVDAPLDEVAATPVPLERWLQRLPAYIADSLVYEVATGQRPAPSVSPGVALAAGLVATAAVEVLLGRRPQVIAPDVAYFDARELRLEIVRHDTTASGA